MKTIPNLTSLTFSLILSLVLVSQSLFSQEVIEVDHTRAQMSKGMQTCYVVGIPEADLQTVQQNWIKKIQEGNKVKVKENNHELILQGVVKSEFSNDSINLYSILIQKENRILLNFFMEIDSVFFAPKEDKTDLASDKIDNSIKNYLRSFAVDQYKLAVTAELDDQQKVLTTMQNDLEKLEKDEENMKKVNSSLENDIDKSEREIVEIEQKIDLKNQEIMTHTTSAQAISSDAVKKAAQQKQKELEKEKNQMEKSRSKEKENISSNKSKIEKNNKDIETSQSNQEKKKEEITNQTEVINQVQTKLDGIK